MTPQDLSLLALLAQRTDDVQVDPAELAALSPAAAGIARNLIAQPGLGPDADAANTLRNWAKDVSAQPQRVRRFEKP